MMFVCIYGPTDVHVIIPSTTSSLGTKSHKAYYGAIKPSNHWGGLPLGLMPIQYNTYTLVPVHIILALKLLGGISSRWASALLRWNLVPFLGILA
jgi:hypothetical protein